MRRATCSSTPPNAETRRRTPTSAYSSAESTNRAMGVSAPSALTSTSGWRPANNPVWAVAVMSSEKSIGALSPAQGTRVGASGYADHTPVRPIQRSSRYVVDGVSSGFFETFNAAPVSSHFVKTPSTSSASRRAVTTIDGYGASGSAANLRCFPASTFVHALKASANGAEPAISAARHASAAAMTLVRNARYASLSCCCNASSSRASSTRSRVFAVGNTWSRSRRVPSVKASSRSGITARSSSARNAGSSSSNPAPTTARSPGARAPR
jgi:hypothetical protein